MTKTQPTKIGKEQSGITKIKKAQLDALALSILDAQQEVDQLQAVVGSLTEKLTNFQSFLATADSSRAQALSNRNSVDQLVQDTQDLLANSGIAFNATAMAGTTIKELARDMKKLVDKLIYCAELVNKFSSLVITKKALNPLISDDLVGMIGQAGNSANNAVALTLVALKSATASQSASMESETTAALEYTQARSLYQSMTGIDFNREKDIATKESNENKTGNFSSGSLHGMICQAYEDACSIFMQREKAVALITQELNLAVGQLKSAEIKLISLQAGLKAANAAALKQ